MLLSGRHSILLRSYKTASLGTFANKGSILDALIREPSTRQLYVSTSSVTISTYHNVEKYLVPQKRRIFPYKLTFKHTNDVCLTFIKHSKHPIMKMLLYTTQIIIQYKHPYNVEL